MAGAHVPVHLIVGDDPYLAAEAVGEVLQGTSDLSVDTFAPGDDPRDVLRALESTSMFGERRGVVVRDLDEFPGELHRELVGYLEDPNPGCVLVLVAKKSPPALAAAVRKVGRLVEAGKGGRSDLFAWLRHRAAGAGLRASGEAMTALVEAVGGERLALDQALEELVLALGKGARLGPDEVRRQFRGRADGKVYGFVDAVAARQRGVALETMHRLLRQGESPQALFWALTRHFRTLLLVGDAPAPRAAQALGMPAWRAEKLVRQARGFAPAALIEAYRTLASADRRMKTGEEPEVLTLERVVASITRG